MFTRSQFKTARFSLIGLLLAILICPIPVARSHSHADDALVYNVDSLARHLHYSHGGAEQEGGDPCELHRHWHLEIDGDSPANLGSEVVCHAIDSLNNGLVDHSRIDSHGIQALSAWDACLKVRSNWANLKFRASSLTGLAFQAVLSTFRF